MPIFNWEHDFAASPSDVWPIVSDMQKIEQVVGMPGVEFRNIPNDLGGSVLHGSARQLGMALEWHERPFEWITNSCYRIERVYTRGPLRRAISLVCVEPSKRGCILTQKMTLEGRNLFWNLVARLFVGVQMKRRFLKTYENIDSFLQDQSAAPMKASLLNNSKPNGTSLRLLARRLARTQNADLIQLLSNHIREGCDRDLARIRPYEMAKEWGKGRKEVLQVMLSGTDVGLLDLSWDLLCPACRNPANNTRELSNVQKTVHCLACNIDYSGDLSKNVEAVFRPSKAVRSVDVEDFCTAGPQTTPHILMQWTLDSKERKTINITLDRGVYRVRGPRFPGSYPIRIDPDEPNGVMEVRPTAEVTQRRSFNSKLSVVLENTSQHEETFLLEQEAWRENAALASEVIATPGFRSYFASEALAPGQNLSIKKLFFLFTDLKNSVRIYELYGDAPAYGACRGHFAAMRTIIESQGGSVVKTVGDSVMAVFVDPVPALLVAQEILNQESVFRPLPLREDLEIKLGLHGGPCIATNANGTLDFFGRTVNMAARFQDLSRGGDLVVSSELAKLREVVGVLDELSLESTEDSAVLKGMTEATSFLRVHLR